METKLIISLLMALGSPSFAQQDIDPANVPSIVVNTFMVTWPKAYDAEWEKHNGQYEVEFEIDHTDYKARIDEAGKVTAYYYDIPVTALPQSVKQTITDHYASYTIEDAIQIEKNNKTYYRVDLDGKLFDREIVFTADGKATNYITGF